MQLMSKKKPETGSRGRGRPRGQQRVPLSMRLPPQIIELLQRLADANRRPLTTEAEIAFEEHLRAAGLWPPPSDLESEA